MPLLMVAVPCRILTCITTVLIPCKQHTKRVANGKRMQQLVKHKCWHSGGCLSLCLLLNMHPSDLATCYIL
jgi:hypothetical protein